MPAPPPDSERSAAPQVARSRANSLALACVLIVIWLLWSGHYTPLLLTFGLLSCLLVLVICHRMQIDDTEGAPLLGLRPFVYAPWLAWQIVLANVDVARRILNPALPIQPHLLRVRAGQKTDLGRVVLANSITLTPGTVSVDMHGNEITVHALTHEAARFDETGEMNRRVLELEGQD